MLLTNTNKVNYKRPMQLTIATLQLYLVQVCLLIHLG